MSEPQLRETIQWDPNTEGFYVRYDFAYIDPASHWQLQYCIDSVSMSKDPATLDEQLVPVARAAIVRMLKRKCGVKRAIENQIHLELPRGAPSRYV
jgi:hypothetical protein